MQWTESVGLTLVHRDLGSMTLKTPVTGATVKYEILQTFPFTSETKRMGIIVRVSEQLVSVSEGMESENVELAVTLCNIVASVPLYEGTGYKSKVAILYSHGITINDYSSLEQLSNTTHSSVCSDTVLIC